MKNMINSNPSYFESPITEFQGNPLVEALLPLPASLPEAFERLAKKPDFDENERDLPSCHRALLPARLLNFMFPTTQHIELQARMYGQVLNGYRWRNPFDDLQLFNSEGLNEDEEYDSDEEYDGDDCYDFDEGCDVTDLRQPSFSQQMRPTVSFLTGHSGMGTSTLIRAIMRSMGKPVIAHSNYKGVPFTETQILYMLQNVPCQCSAKAMLKSFGDSADQLLGRKVYTNLVTGKTMRTNDYLTALRQVAATHHVGALVFDELQNIALVSSRGKDEFLGLIRDLHGELGIPIILVGDYRAASILMDDSSACRLIDGIHELKRPESYEDTDWRLLCNVIWRYQWVRKPQALNDEVLQILYKYSQGITAILLNLFVTTQTLALEQGMETVTPALIAKVYKDRFRLLHPVIEILNRNDPGRWPSSRRIRCSELE
jgi:hypothetical protein